MLRFLTLVTTHCLYISHIFEIIFQGNYAREGLKAILSFSIDPVVLFLNAFYFQDVLSPLGLCLLLLNGGMHLVHFALILLKQGALYKDGRPRWYSVFFNAFDLALMMPAVSEIVIHHTSQSNLRASFMACCVVLYSYMLSGRH